MKQLTPRQIVKELDRYIVGQHECKKSGCDRIKESLASARW